MKKIIIILIALLLLFVFFNGDKIDLQEVVFEGIDMNNTSYKFTGGELDFNYNIVYSPFLPAGGIYSITDTVTGKEAIIQIGLAEVDESPYMLYLTENLFNFFASSYEKEIKKIKFKIKFLAWNKEGEEAANLNIYNLIVTPENSIEKIKKNGEDQFYLQIGAFSYYQNSYPIIINLLPSLKVTPKFYMVTKNGENEKPGMFRVLAGPYSLEKARDIAKSINAKKKSTVFIKSSNTVLKEFGKSSEKGK
jgi:hypothetical protein